MTNMCYHPWVGLDITPQGEFRPCCKYSHFIADNLSDYQNSSELKELQNQFLQGQRPERCKRCWDDEDANLPSKRQLDWQYVFHSKAPDIKSIKILSLPFGNSCNLACRTCNSASSSGWISESEKLRKYFPDIKIYKHQRFYQDEKFINEIKNISSDLIHVEFPGGEPFLAGVNEHLDFLDFLILNDSKNTSLHYMTNASIFPDDRFWVRWEKFKKVDIQLSIDGIYNQFEYMRWPAVWSSVENNVKSYINKKSNNIQISLSHTVSIFNVFYLPEFIKWCLQNKLGKPYLGMVSSPKMYSIKALPQQVKETLGKKLDRFTFKEIVNYMYSEDLNEEFAGAIKHIHALDQQRNQSFNETFPEFYNILKDAGCQI